jgi:hypothetical protein
MKLMIFIFLLWVTDFCRDICDSLAKNKDDADFTIHKDKAACRV